MNIEFIMIFYLKNSNSSLSGILNSLFDLRSNSIINSLLIFSFIKCENRTKLRLKVFTYDFSLDDKKIPMPLNLSLNT